MLVTWADEVRSAMVPRDETAAGKNFVLGKNGTRCVFRCPALARSAVGESAQPCGCTNGVISRWSGSMALNFEHIYLSTLHTISKRTIRTE